MNKDGTSTTTTVSGVSSPAPETRGKPLESYITPTAAIWYRFL